MAIKIDCLGDGEGIEIVASGVVTGEEIIEVHKEIYSETNLKRQKYQIIDRTGCTDYCVTPEDVRKIADIDKEAAKTNPHIIIAVVSPTYLQFTMSKMWRAYVNDSCFLTAIFSDRGKADKWIKEQLNRP